MKSRYLGRDKAIHQQKRKIGVLLTNLGTPDEPTSGALRKYLRQFLSDPRVVEIPRFIWMIILHGIILRVRPQKSAKLYESIWTDKGSPLMVISQDMRDKIAQQLNASEQDELVIDIAMRYGEPAIPKALNRMQEQGVDKLIVLPLYPQYAGPTTASAFDEVTNELAKWRWIPSLHFINGYHDHPLYIQALANSIKEHFEAHGEPDKLILSYHGMPKHFLDSGDPYFCFCHKTTRLVTEKLGLAEDKFMTTFQSRFGKAEWLKPYTDETLEGLPAQGVKNVAIISPAFSADCLETLEELVHENKDIFIEAGGEAYSYIPALNDRDDHCNALAAIIAAQIEACKQQ
ncbi:ferrochelatase [Thalassotalea marina]|uniref:Ferrochelatase n=1 Tax=Thalassotalea marina TaxID=1673741 RepID=A0A919EFV1_9GAMM|nr:ferrochelatase [Thalassotalea marina]GHF77545.1 ferrochelatase 2 [Thalassotalea marina]